MTQDDEKTRSETSSAAKEEHLVAFAAGELIVEEGREEAVLYLVAQGEVELVRQAGPSERRLRLAGAGDFFGETTVLEEGTPHEATARAVTDCRVLPLDAELFHHVLRRHPDVVLRMMRDLARRLRTHEQETRRAHDLAAGVLGDVPRHRIRTMEATSRVRPEAEVDDAAAAPPEDVAGDPPRGAELRHASGRAFSLDPTRRQVIGRFDPVNRTGPEIDLDPVDPSKSTSRRHAVLWYEPGEGFMLSEEPSTVNGTWVAGDRLGPGAVVPLRHGARLRFGQVELELYAPSAEPSR